MPDVINLPQLLDMSLGSPEAGAVNFNQLHKLLLEIIKKLNLTGHPVQLSEFSDIDAKKTAKAASLGFVRASDSLGPALDSNTLLPNVSQEMIAKIKSNTPLTDMWQHMQFEKRIGNNEEGINTVSSSTCL